MSEEQQAALELQQFGPPDARRIGTSQIGKAPRASAPMSLAIAMPLHVSHCHFSVVSGMW